MIFRLIVINILFFEVTSADVKVEHVLRSKIGYKIKTLTYVKTVKGYLKTQEINYFDDGRKQSIYSYENGTKHGKYIKWNFILKKNKYAEIKRKYFIAEKGNFKNGRRSGGLRAYFPSGRIHWEAIYHNGLIKGPAQEFYSNGKVYRSLNYLEGEKNGKYKVYYEDGSIEIEGGYFYGMRYGIWKFYSPEEQILEEIEYKDGFPWEGTYTNWESQPIISPCRDQPMLHGFKYHDGTENIIYRDNNNSIIICDDK